jgi:putative peptidoglycan lipid II flippase
MILVTQLAGIVQTNVASLAGSDGASLTVLRYSWLIFMLPHSIVTVSIATAYFTRMSGHAHRGDLASLRSDISSSLRAMGLIVVFASVGLIVLAYPFAAVFSKHGFDETQAMGNVLIAFLVGLVPFSILFVLQRTFYALEDTRTPFFVQVFQSVLFVIGALGVAMLPPSQIAVGIGVVTTIAGLAQTVVTALLLRGRVGGLGGRLVIRKYLVFLLAALPAAAVGVGLDFLLGAFGGGFAVSGVLASLVSMALIGAIMLAIYVAVLAALRTQELRDLLTPLRSRLRRRSRGLE